MAQVGYGTKVEYKVGAGSYTEIEDVVDLELPTPKVAIAKYQPMRTTRYKRIKAGTGEYSELKITFVHVAATWTTLAALVFDESLTWRITRSDGSATEVFAGIIMEAPRTVKQDEVDLDTLSVAVDNSITFS